MTNEAIEEVKAVLYESGKKMWDNAVEACAQYVELSAGQSTEEVAAGLRRLSFSVTPRPDPPSPCASTGDPNG